MKDSIPENLEKYYKSIRKHEITQQKMGRRLEQIIHKKGDPKGQNTKIHIRRYVTLLLVPGAIQIKTALKYYHLHPLPWLKFIRLLIPAVCKLVGMNPLKRLSADSVKFQYTQAHVCNIHIL